MTHPNPDTTPQNPQDNIPDETDDSAAELESNFNSQPDAIDLLTDELEQARQTIRQLELRQEIDQHLNEQQTIDIEVTRLLTQSAVQLMQEPDIKQAVSDLKQRKPYLFSIANDSNIGAMGPRHSTFQQDPQLRAKAKAKETGNRMDLLSYLRSKR